MFLSTLTNAFRIPIAILIGLALFSCEPTPQTSEGDKLNVVTTTTMLTDLARNIGGTAINVQGLMGSGVDPHLYKATEGDVTKLTRADVVFYTGLHLEGKLVEVFEKMGRNTNTVALAEVINTAELIGSENFASNYDPHVWFNIKFWIQIAKHMTEQLSTLDPENAVVYTKNFEKYQVELQKLEKEVQALIAELAQEKRILVTAHDAFNYFGKEYGFEVIGLQGLSTATEAGVQDVQRLAKLIIDREVKAIFVESSVPKRTIEALQKAVKAAGYEVAIGGTLYSDALGSPGTPEGEYLGMFRSNVKTIVQALK